ncbi:MAG: FkbM family methyltransferase [Rhodanobacteraceae bacterium]
MKDLEHLRRVWQTLGREDPLWAVLSHSDKRGGRWAVDEFLATGRAEIDPVVGGFAAHDMPASRRLALDFGCGAGRLTRALAAHFEQVVGVDVSSSMIETARALNRDVANIEFRENPSPRLDGIADASVDFVYSIMTLQHIPARLAAGYVDEFFRVLAPGGVAVFQFVTSADDSLRGQLFARVPNRWLNPLRRLAWRRSTVFEMHALDEAELERVLAKHPHVQILDAVDDPAAGRGWAGRRWFVVNRDELPVEVALDGYRVQARASDAHIGANVIAGLAHDANVGAALRARLRPGATFVDIGANIGVFTGLGASLVGPEGRVIAVEPIARNIELIERMCRSNGFANVRVIRAAASDHAGSIALRTEATTSNATTPAAAGVRLRAENGTTLEVRAVVLDDALADLDRLDVVKIDVAGMEPRVLRGLSRTLARFRPALITEFHPWAIERASGEAPIEVLRRLLAIYGAGSVLHRDGTVERVVDPEAVIAAWRRVDEDLGTNGLAHLDLVFDA